MKYTSIALCLLLIACNGGTSTSTNVASNNIITITQTNESAQFVSLAAQTFVPLDTHVNSTSTISIEPQIKYQTLSGFGAALTGSSAFLIYNLPLEQQTQVLSKLFSSDNGIGITYIRVPMSASDFSLGNYTYDDMPLGYTDPLLLNFTIAGAEQYIIPVLHKILQINPNIKIMLTPWTSPPWMKSNNSFFGETGVAPNAALGELLPEYYASYADFFVKTIFAYQMAGISVTALTVQNEPLNPATSYPAMVMYKESQSNFFNDYLAPAFDENNIQNVQVFSYDHNWDDIYYPEYVFNHLNNVAQKHVLGVAFHCYGGNVESQTTFHNNVPNAQIMMTECSGGDWATNWSDNFVWDEQNLFIGAVNNWASGSMKWNIALDQNNGPSNGGCLNCRGLLTINTSLNQVTYNEDYYAVGTMSKYFKPGAIRVKSTLNNSNLIATAAINQEGTFVLAVLNQSDTTQQFSIILSGQEYVNSSIPSKTVAVYSW